MSTPVVPKDWHVQIGEPLDEWPAPAWKAAYNGERPVLVLADMPTPGALTPKPIRHGGGLWAIEPFEVVEGLPHGLRDIARLVGDVRKLNPDGLDSLEAVLTEQIAASTASKALRGRAQTEAAQLLTRPAGRAVLAHLSPATVLCTPQTVWPLRTDLRNGSLGYSIGSWAASCGHDAAATTAELAHRLGFSQESALRWALVMAVVHAGQPEADRLLADHGWAK